AMAPAAATGGQADSTSPEWLATAAGGGISGTGEEEKGSLREVPAGTTVEQVAPAGSASASTAVPPPQAPAGAPAERAPEVSAGQVLADHAGAGGPAPSA